MNLPLLLFTLTINYCAAYISESRFGSQLRYKLVVIGESSVGKSSLAVRYANGTFDARKESTVGASFLTKTLPVDGETVRLDIWDTAGQERYHCLTPMYYRGAQAALVVYDITDKASFNRAQQWIEELWRESSMMLIMLVGNKLDLENSRQVNIKEAKEFAGVSNLHFAECSAKTGANIDQIFTTVMENLVQNDPGRPQLRENIGSRRSHWELSNAMNLDDNLHADISTGYCC